MKPRSLLGLMLVSLLGLGLMLVLASAKQAMAQPGSTEEPAKLALKLWDVTKNSATEGEFRVQWICYDNQNDHDVKVHVKITKPNGTTYTEWTATFTDPSPGSLVYYEITATEHSSDRNWIYAGCKIEWWWEDLDGPSGSAIDDTTVSWPSACEVNNGHWRVWRIDGTNDGANDLAYCTVDFTYAFDSSTTTDHGIVLETMDMDDNVLALDNSFPVQRYPYRCQYGYFAGKHNIPINFGTVIGNGKSFLDPDNYIDPPAEEWLLRLSIQRTTTNGTIIIDEVYAVYAEDVPRQNATDENNGDFG